MAKKKTKNQPKKKQVNAENVIGLHSEVTDQPITQTLEVNYMPYAMSVNVSRAFPEIDGFKPSHRKLLYTMYKMGLLKGERQKSANIVGQTMKLNPHGDAATGNEALLAPFVESKGNFGKYYSGDLSYAASRYTEAKLSPISAEIFKDIDKDPVDFVDSYDGAMKEPRLLPTTFPNILVSANKGIRLLDRRRDYLPPRGDGEDHRDRPWQLPDPLPLALDSRRAHHRGLRDPLHHQDRCHHRAHRQALQGGQGQGDRRYPRRDRPLGPAHRYRS